MIRRAISRLLDHLFPRRVVKREMEMLRVHFAEVDRRHKEKWRDIIEEHRAIFDSYMDSHH